MKIAFLLQSFPCLSETFILNQITGLIDLGCEVKIIAFNKSPDEKQHLDVQKYGLLNKTVYINVPQSKLAKRTKAAAQTIAAFIRHPVLVYRLQKKLLTRPISFSYKELFMALALLQGNFDIVQCHYGPVGNQALLLKEIGYKAKISTVFHGYDLSVYLNEHGPDVYRELFSKGDVFLPISTFWKQKLIALGCPEDKIRVNYMGVDADFFKPRNQKIISDKIKILTIARFTEKKGYRYALQAFREALDTIPDMEYHIAGDGPLFEQIHKLTHDLGIENHVKFHGKVDRSQACALYNNADIFLLPSITSPEGDMEGIPVSLMEAMACGLPVITSEHSGIPELVNNGRSGFVVPEKNASMIAERIICLANKPDLRNKQGHQARIYVEEHFNNHILTRKLLEIFKEQVYANDIQTE